MSTRRAHQKTKHGCAACKKRRVKCDEQRPTCKNCDRRGIGCSFQNDDPKGSTLPDANALFKVHVFRQQSSPSISYELPPESLLNAHAVDKMMQNYPNAMQSQFRSLLRHFTHSTRLSLALDKRSINVWPLAVTQLISEYPFVLRAVFALTSLHVSRSLLNDSDRNYHLNIAAGQLNIGISQYWNSLQEMSQQNADALFAFSTMLTTYVLTVAGDECGAALDRVQSNHVTVAQRQLASNEATEQVLRILKSLRGTMIVVVPCYNYISAGVFKPVTSKEWWPETRVPATEEAAEEDRMLKSLQNMWVGRGRKYEYYFDSLESTLKLLRECFVLVSQLSTDHETLQTGGITDWSAIFFFICKVSMGFLRLLDERVPEAWVILAHYAILSSRSKKSKAEWWLNNMDVNIIMTAALVLGEDNWDLIRWPASIVEVNLDSLRCGSVVDARAVSQSKTAIEIVAKP
ncbi:hypothetical protein EJ04DRAFT_561862 [Polyplosphaeria fusca]|uniref:Zn(2)-C6 fungal-type domain-containing protein n=1 Tax=Polyplosphaeria fusca TaxID=682080 RepID=A0A9P4R337_9PLEO|nr:hypothetical protein EJ04DRAFT_561862 [Polyplosphaeria fusca]